VTYQDMFRDNRRALKSRAFRDLVRAFTVGVLIGLCLLGAVVVDARNSPKFRELVGARPTTVAESDDEVSRATSGFAERLDSANLQLSQICDSDRRGGGSALSFYETRQERPLQTGTRLHRGKPTG